MAAPSKARHSISHGEPPVTPGREPLTFRRSRRESGPSTPWPTYCRDSLTLGERPDVAICSLSTPREPLARAFAPHDYGVIGNLYSREGVNLLLRNVLANPRIRHLLLCGVDLSGTGAVLRKLIADGVDADHQLVGTTLRIDDLIPLDAIEAFRAGIVLHDFRGERDPLRIRQVIEHLPSLPPFAQPRVFPREEPRLDSYPAEETGHVVRAGTVAVAWRQAVTEIMRFGRVTPTAYGSRQRELLDLVTIVQAEDPTSPELRTWLPVSEELIEQYAPLMLEQGDGSRVSYTYGSRLRAFHGRDQLEAMAPTCGRSPKAGARWRSCGTRRLTLNWGIHPVW